MWDKAKTKRERNRIESVGKLRINHIFNIHRPHIAGDAINYTCIRQSQPSQTDKQTHRVIPRDNGTTHVDASQLSISDSKQP